MRKTAVTSPRSRSHPHSPRGESHQVTPQPTPSGQSWPGAGLGALLLGAFLAAPLHAQTPAPQPTPTPTPGAVRLSEEVVVQGIRAEERTPVSKTDIDRDAIVLVNRGQEMPYLLGATPAVNFQSDSGIAAGYAYFNVRGIGQTRLNITLDGVPLSDPEDQALYFSNFGDFASVVDSIQVQRGVGTSSVGGASYGGSVNFASVGPADKPRLEAQAGGGSWGSARGTLAASGPVGPLSLFVARDRISRIVHHRLTGEFIEIQGGQGKKKIPLRLSKEGWTDLDVLCDQMGIPRS